MVDLLLPKYILGGCQQLLTSRSYFNYLSYVYKGIEHMQEKKIPTSLHPDAFKSLIFLSILQLVQVGIGSTQQG